jgi:hypothetical protein
LVIYLGVKDYLAEKTKVQTRGFHKRNNHLWLTPFTAERLQRFRVKE